MRKLERMAYRNAQKALRLHAPHISQTQHTWASTECENLNAWPIAMRKKPLGSMHRIYHKHSTPGQAQNAKI